MNILDAFQAIARRDYCALLAYVERNTHHCGALKKIWVMIRDGKQMASCLGLGRALSIRWSASTRACHECRFGVVQAAQARGDFDVLAERGRRILRVHLGAHVAAGLTTLGDVVRQALA